MPLIVKIPCEICRDGGSYLAGQYEFLDFGAERDMPVVEGHENLLPIAFLGIKDGYSVFSCHTKRFFCRNIASGIKGFYNMFGMIALR